MAITCKLCNKYLENSRKSFCDKCGRIQIHKRTMMVNKRRQSHRQVFMDTGDKPSDIL